MGHPGSHEEARKTLRLADRTRAVAVGADHRGVIVEAAQRGHERIGIAVIHQQLSTVPLEGSEVGIVGVERLLPGFAAARGLAVGQSHVAVEIDVQIAEARLSREHSVLEERRRAAARRVQIADQHLAPESLAAG